MAAAFKPAHANHSANSIPLSSSVSGHLKKKKTLLLCCSLSVSLWDRIRYFPLHVMLATCGRSCLFRAAPAAPKAELTVRAHPRLNNPEWM